MLEFVWTRDMDLLFYRLTTWSKGLKVWRVYQAAGQDRNLGELFPLNDCKWKGIHLIMNQQEPVPIWSLVLHGPNSLPREEDQLDNSGREIKDVLRDFVNCCLQTEEVVTQWKEPKVNQHIFGGEIKFEWSRGFLIFRPCRGNQKAPLVRCRLLDVGHCWALTLSI